MVAGPPARPARRLRRLAAAIALAMAAVVAAAVVLPRLGHGGDTRPRLYVSGVAGPERWRPGPLVAVAPLEGFEVDVPAGWEASPTWKGIDLRPVDPELRRRLAGPVQFGTAHLQQFYNPAPNGWKDGSYKEEGFDLPKPARPGPHAPGPTAWTAAAWCWCAAPTPRGRRAATPWWSSSWRARTSANLVPCTVRGPLGVELVDRTGRRLEVEGNGLALAPPVELPESSVGQSPGRRSWA